MSVMASEIRKLVTRAVLVPMLVMAALSCLLAWQVGQLVRDAGRVEHADLVTTQASRTQKLLLDMETAWRGYAITADPAYLDQYEAERHEIDEALEALAAIVSDNDSEREQVDELRAEYPRWAVLAQSSLPHDHGNLGNSPAEVERRVTLDARRRSMDSMRSIATTIIDREEELRRVRQAQANHANALAGVAGVATLGFVGAVLLVVTRRNLLLVTGRFQRMVESERHARENAEEALRARESFLQMASHELKTPITSLRLQLESILRYFARRAATSEPVDATRLDQKARAALRQLTRLQTLVTSLLDVQRLSATDADLRMTEVDAMLVAREALTRIESDVRDSGCEVTIEGPVRMMVLADPTRLDQVVTNLLTNAIKYGRGQPVALRLAREGTRSTIAVEDHGIGISVEDQARIFQRFARAVSGEHFHGFGLGLWIAKSLVDRMGGTLRVDSQPGKGSTFVVDLPNGADDAIEATVNRSSSQLMKSARP